MSEWIDARIARPPEGMKVLIWNEEGPEIANYINAEPDGPDTMGHDAGWCGMHAFPSRSFGAEEFRADAQGQATHWKLITPPTHKD